LSGAVVWRRFWRPAAARTGPCGQPRFSALQKTGKNIEMAANAKRFSGSVSEWCGRAVLLPGSCPRFLPGSCPAAGSCPVPARFLPLALPDGRRRAGTASVGRFLRRNRAATAAPL